LRPCGEDLVLAIFKGRMICQTCVLKYEPQFRLHAARDRELGGRLLHPSARSGDRTL